MIVSFKIALGIYDKDTTKFLKLRDHDTERAEGRGQSTSTAISTEGTKSYKKGVLQFEGSAIMEYSSPIHCRIE